MDSENSKMKISAFKIFGACVLSAILAILVTQRRAISQTRAANETLRQQNATATATSLTERSQDSTQEIEALQSANRDLPKLRNEVRKLREDKRELEKLQTENERLAAALKAAPKTSAPRMSEAEGFVLKQTWSKAGFATPEATVQTFFWAVANKDFRALAECATGDARKDMEVQMQRIAEGDQFENQFEPLAQMQGFRIAEKKQISATTVELGIQASAGGRAMPMRLQLVNGEWKLSD
jgi:DNA repair exonuclease SbcCD ATPase subunit